MTYKKVNSPSTHFTRYMEHQLQELQGVSEYQTDEVLAQLIYAQRMNEMIAQLQHSDQLVDFRPSSNDWAANLDKLFADLDKLRRSESQQKSHRCE